MGTWRLRSRVCPQIAALVAQIEGAWRSALGADLALYPMLKVGSRGWGDTAR